MFYFDKKEVHSFRGIFFFLCVYNCKIVFIKIHENYYLLVELNNIVKMLNILRLNKRQRMHLIKGAVLIGIIDFRSIDNDDKTAEIPIKGAVLIIAAS